MLIDRDAALAAVEEAMLNGANPYKAVASLPTVGKPTPGRWIKRKRWTRCVCSACSMESVNEYPYCPNCGAKMYGGAE